MPLLTTAVVGAGPAGLIFCAAGRLLAEKAGIADTWKIRLFDKRDAYVRTHRLRMDPAPYRALQQDVSDLRFDALIAFLEGEHFTPEVNLLEAKLSELVRSLGVERELLAVGDGPGETTLAALREKLGPGPVTIVGADSVHSTIRAWVQGAAVQTRHTHERVARIRVVGPNLPETLGTLDQVRLSKLLGSIVDYRLNRNGFAEVDLFLTPSEHAAVRDLGATPAQPVPLTSAMLAGVPFFRAIVAHFERGPVQVLLQSTFQLEHAVMPVVAFAHPVAPVFLVGDAAVSLPFFRGMASLGACAHALAQTHRDLLLGKTDAVAQYDAAAAAVKAREIGIVASRARAIRVLREVVRVSALLPFPIQSWFLTTDETPRTRDRVTTGLVANVVLALAGTVLVGLGVQTFSLPLLAAALPVQLVGGAAYRATLSFEPGPHRLVRRVWEVQIASAFAIGALEIAATWYRPAVIAIGSTLWFVLGLCFLGGLVAYEKIVAAWFGRAGLAER